MTLQAPIIAFPPSAAPEAPRGVIELSRAAVQIKPWGREVAFSAHGELYVSKIMYVNQGRSLSLDLGQETTKTICILKGTARIEFGITSPGMATRECYHRDTIHLSAAAAHRLTALSDLIFVECSTAAQDGPQNVARLNDPVGVKAPLHGREQS